MPDAVVGVVVEPAGIAARIEEARTLRSIDEIMGQLKLRGTELLGVARGEAQARVQARLQTLQARLEAQRKATAVLPPTAPQQAAMPRPAEEVPVLEELGQAPGPQPPAPQRGQSLGRVTTGVEAELIPRMAYVPTGIAHLLGDSALFGPRPMATVRVRWDVDPAVDLLEEQSGVKRLRVEAVVEGYSAREVQTREVDMAAGETSFDLMPAFFADRLKQVTETQRAALYVKVSQLSSDGRTNDLVELEQTVQIWLLARHAACVWMKDPGTGEMRDYSYALGTWVTPNEPSVLALLARAAGQHVNAFFGRQGRTDEAIEHQVRLLYDTLHKSEWSYTGFITTTPKVDGSFFQRVRLPREVLQLQSGNCLDSALLFASLLEAASLAPALVLMRDHAFVAWERVDGSWAHLDTSYLGRADYAFASAKGEEEAEIRSEMAALMRDPEHFRRWPLAELRLRGVIPLE
jgi:hypothetical protein